MGKKKNAIAAPIEASSVAATAGDATLDTTGATTTARSRPTHEVELLQVDLGDMVKLKQVLDESVVAAILEHLPEDYAWDNLKLGLMAAACAFAMMAQFAPLPFPECRPILGVCGSLYFILSGVLQAIATFIDKDTILWTPVLTHSHTTSKNKDLEKYGVRVRSSLPRFSEWFTVTLELHDSKKKDAVPVAPLPYVSQTWSVGQFFDKDGYFDEVGLGMEIDRLYERLDAAQYDVKSKKD